MIGAGAVGVEFASIFRTFGTEVTILEFLPRVVPVEDEEISKELTRLFKKRGIDVNTGAKVEKVEKTEAGVKVSYTDANGKAQDERGREGAGRRGPRAADERHRRGEDAHRAGARIYQGRTKRRRPPSRASLPSATLWPGCRNWRMWAR